MKRPLVQSRPKPAASQTQPWWIVFLYPTVACLGPFVLVLLFDLVGLVLGSSALVLFLVHIRRSRNRRRAIALVSLISACAVLLPVILFVPTLSILDAEGRRVICHNNLKQIAVALYKYHEQHSTFPPAYLTDTNGKRMHSWRVLILPYLGYNDLYARYDFSQPWNGPNNRLLLGDMPLCYACPESITKGNRITNYLAIVGQKTAWPGKRGLARKGIADGVWSTIQVVEAANSKIEWMEPCDLSYSGAMSDIKREDKFCTTSVHVARVGSLWKKAGTHAAFSDGSVVLLPVGLAPEILRGLVTVNGGERYTPVMLDAKTIDRHKVVALGMFFLVVVTYISGVCIQHEAVEQV